MEQPIKQIKQACAEYERGLITKWELRNEIRAALIDIEVSYGLEELEAYVQPLD